MQAASRLKSIRYRFMSIPVIAILMTVLLFSALSLFLLSDFYQSLQREKLEAHASSLAIESDQIINQLINDLQGINLFDFYLTGRNEPVLQEFRRNSASFPKIVLLTSTGREAIKFVAGRQLVELGEQGRGQEFLQALEQPNRVLVSVKEQDSDFNAPALVFSQARSGRYDSTLEAVLQATVPLSDFTRRFSRRHIQEEVAQVLIDSHGRMLSHPQSERLFLPLFSSPGQLEIVTAGQGSNSVGFCQGVADGQESSFAYAGLLKAPWTAVAILQKSYFNQLLNRWLVYCLLIGLGGLLLGAMLAHIMGRPILENIQRIKQQTQTLAEGKLDQRVEMRSGDELEDLAGAVNLLTERLVHTRQARDSLDLMLRTVIDPLVITDINGQVQKTNPAAQAFFGLSEKEFDGRGLSSFFAADSPLSDDEELQSLFAQGDFNNFETEVRGAAAKKLPVLFSAAHANQGKTEGYVVSILKDMSEQKNAEQRIARLAYYDTLTGLPNRTLLSNRLDKVLHLAKRDFRDGFHFGLMFLDLDHFKVVNDTLGHSFGDQLLQAAAQRLKDCLRRSDTISRPQDGSSEDNVHEQLLARLGGDEFVVLLPKLRCAEDAAMIARRIIKDMSEPFLLGHQEVVTPASVGIAIYPGDGQDVDTLLRHADVAMYHAKEKGRNSFYFYSDEMNKSARDRLFLENRLRADIGQQQGFQVAYQPKVDMQTGQVCGMEALVRWENDELGMVSPVRFIPIAEESGLIVPLGRWILKTACTQLKTWVEQSGRPMKIAVNLSGRQLKQPDLVPMVAEVLEETGLDPELLELELTESMLMETVENTIDLLQQLKRLGVTLAIDDFGTGYSSLSYLTRFPIDTLKIDRSFVNDLESDQNDATIVEAIVVMAHSLGLQVVAEGVENEFQQQFLKERGCDQFQGFLFSKPVYFEEFFQRFIEPLDAGQSPAQGTADLRS